MIRLAHLLEKVIDRVNNQQDEFRAAHDGIDGIFPGAQEQADGKQIKGNRKDDDYLSKGSIFYQPIYIIGKKRVFNNRKNVEEKIIGGTPDKVKVSIN